MKGLKSAENSGSEPGMLESWITFCEEELDRDPGDVESRAMLAMCLGQTGRTSEAVREFSTCLRQDPQNGTALLYFGNFLCIQGDPHRGAKQLELAIPNCSDASEWVLAIGSLGVAHHMCGERSKALDCWKVLLQLPPLPTIDFSLHLSLAIVYLQNGWMDRALEEFRYAHEVREDDATMPRRLPGVILEMEREQLSSWSTDRSAQEVLNIAILLTWGICRPEDMF